MTQIMRRLCLRKGHPVDAERRNKGLEYACLRTYQPKLLTIWGKDDPSFIWEGAEAFTKDLLEAKIVPVDSGHLSLENRCTEIAENIKGFF